MEIDWNEVSDGERVAFRVVLGRVVCNVFCEGGDLWAATAGVLRPDIDMTATMLDMKFDLPSRAEAQAWVIAAAQHAVQPLIGAAVAAEREACAQMAGDRAKLHEWAIYAATSDVESTQATARANEARELEAAIRARGTT